MDAVTWFLTGPYLYATVLLFLLGSGYRIVVLLRMPRHLRWELYPIPHLGPAGSKYQQVDFTRSPRRHSRLAPVLFMAGEILLLKKVFLNRRDLWLGSWLLHVGLYLWFLFLGLLVAGAVFDGLGLTILAESGWLWRRILHRTTIAAGSGGMIVGLPGALLLLWRRWRDVGLREMSDRITSFNLFLLLTLFGSGLIAWLTADPAFGRCRDHVALPALRASGRGGPAEPGCGDGSGGIVPGLPALQPDVSCRGQVFLLSRRPLGRRTHIAGQPDGAGL